MTVLSNFQVVHGRAGWTTFGIPLLLVASEELSPASPCRHPTRGESSPGRPSGPLPAIPATQLIQGSRGAASGEGGCLPLLLPPPAPGATEERGAEEPADAAVRIRWRLDLGVLSAWLLTQPGSCSAAGLLHVSLPLTILRSSKESPECGWDGS